MKSVVVEDDAIVDAHAVNENKTAMQNAAAMITAVAKKRVAQAKVRALVKHEQVRARPPGFFFAVVLRAGQKFLALAVNGAGAFDGDILGVGGGNQNDVAVSRRNALARVIM